MDGSGNVYVTGYSIGSVTGPDYATIKYAPDGTRLWVSRYNGPGSGVDDAYAIGVDGSGNVYVTGQSWNGSNYDYATVKYDADGNQQWVQGYGGTGGTDFARDIYVDESSNVYVTGSSVFAPSGGDLDYVTIKYDSSGSVIWLKRFDGPASGDDSASAITLDASGNVIVTGQFKIQSIPPYELRGYGTIKYDPSGNFLWARTVNPPPNLRDYAYDIAIDGSGNVYVTGRGNGVALDYLTVKYDPNGNLQWTKTYNGPGSSNDFATAIAIDGFGNACVTGQSVGTDLDYATIKYDPSGNQSWVVRYDGGYADDFATSIAIDASDDIYVTGGSIGSGSGFDFATIKYDSGGTELWVERYNGTGNTDDAGYGIGVDNTGNVYVAGFSGGSGTSQDCASIKYWQNYSPDPFSLLSPEHEASFPPGYVDFDWEDSVDPDPWDEVRYDLYLSTSQTFHQDSTVVYDSLLTSEYSDNLDVGTYYWKVRAYDDHAEVWSNQTWSFALTIFPGLVGYWRFNEGTGDIAYDVSGYENHGTLMFEPTWVDGLPLLGNALEFDGIDDYVEVIDAPSLDVNGQGITYMAWIYSPAFNECGWIMGKGTSQNNIVWHMLARANNYVRYWIRSGGTYTEREVPDVLSTNIWQHLAVVYDGSYMRFYLDAEEKDNYPKTGNMDVNDEPLYIGLDGWYQSNHYLGKIDEVKIYNYALSPEEIETEFEACFVRGDANASGTVEPGDVVYLINYLFQNGPSPNPYASGDCNCDGEVGPGDVVYLINYLFRGGPAPSC
jgi:hypothetical protein